MAQDNSIQKEELRASGELFLVLDLGVDILQAGLATYNKQDEKTAILKYEQDLTPQDSFQKDFYFDEQKIFGTLSALISELETSPKNKTSYCFLAAPANYLAGRVYSFNFQRQDPQAVIDLRELENVFIKTTFQIKDKIKEDLKQRINGVGAHLIGGHLLNLKLDGYPVANPENLSGQQIAGQIFYVYTTEDCWQHWQKLIELLHCQEVFLMPRFWPLVQALPTDSGIIIDIDRQQTEISLKKQNLLVGQLAFNIGSISFDHALAETLSIGLSEAKEIKLKYLTHNLSSQAQNRFDEIFKPVRQSWLQGVVVALHDLSPNAILPENIFITGDNDLLIDLIGDLKQVLLTEKLSFLDKNRLTIESLEDQVPAKNKAQDVYLNKGQKIVLSSLCQVAISFFKNASPITRILEKSIKLAH